MSHNSLVIGVSAIAEEVIREAGIARLMLSSLNDSDITPSSVTALSAKFATLGINRTISSRVGQADADLEALIEGLEQDATTFSYVRDLTNALFAYSASQALSGKSLKAIQNMMSAAGSDLGSTVSVAVRHLAPHFKGSHTTEAVRAGVSVSQFLASIRESVGSALVFLDALDSDKLSIDADSLRFSFTRDRAYKGKWTKPVSRLAAATVPAEILWTGAGAETGVRDYGQAGPVAIAGNGNSHHVYETWGNVFAMGFSYLGDGATVVFPANTNPAGLYDVARGSGESMRVSWKCHIGYLPYTVAALTTGATYVLVIEYARTAFGAVINASDWIELDRVAINAETTAATPVQVHENRQYEVVLTARDARVSNVAVRYNLVATTGGTLPAPPAAAVHSLIIELSEGASRLYHDAPNFPVAWVDESHNMIQSERFLYRDLFGRYVGVTSPDSTVLGTTVDLMAAMLASREGEIEALERVLHYMENSYRYINRTTQWSVKYANITGITQVDIAAWLAYPRRWGHFRNNGLNPSCLTSFVKEMRSDITLWHAAYSTDPGLMRHIEEVRSGDDS
jgi:hypothetical protein